MSSTCKCLRVLDNEVALTCSKVYLLIIKRYNVEDISAIVLSVPAQEHGYFFIHPFHTVSQESPRITITVSLQLSSQLTQQTNKQTNVYVLQIRNTKKLKKDTDRKKHEFVDPCSFAHTKLIHPAKKMVGIILIKLSIFVVADCNQLYLYQTN